MCGSKVVPVHDLARAPCVMRREGDHQTLMRPYADNTFYIIGMKKGWFDEVGVKFEPAPYGLKANDSIGKTVTSQYALFVPGPTKNPHDAAHTPGGSSSGSAAAVAAKLAPRSARHADEWLDHPASLLLRRRRLQAEPRRAAAHRGVAACDAHRPSGRDGAERL